MSGNKKRTSIDEEKSLTSPTPCHGVGESSVFSKDSAKFLKVHQPIFQNLSPSVRRAIQQKTYEMKKHILETSFFKSINEKDIDRTLQFLMAATNSQENYKELLKKLR